ncbi:MAG: hypothetical protein DA408_05325 [Bacteroidetes bacterium]|nr:MAG: hypothetical protein C7N36_06820 [Bacteroidota bacterium]PTM13879.1 MAG: hypothetical protein DA408_05325 [Bacteroidota bacterium]
MYKILCPTDFSTVADIALDAAILLGKTLSAELHLFHCTEFPTYWSEGLEKSASYNPFRDAVTALTKAELTKRKMKIKAANLPCLIHVDKGNFINRISELTTLIAFDFIVIGSHGASGKREWLLGSNTQKVVRRLHSNILVIKDSLPEIKFDQVLFATNLLPEDQPALKNLLALVPVLGIKTIQLVYIHTGGFFNPPQVVMQETMKDFAQLVHPVPCTTHYFHDFSVEAGIRHFTTQHGTDLVAISNHNRHPLKRLFQGSTVEMLVNQTELPVLSIDF